jgi:hypothetical protein
MRAETSTSSGRRALRTTTPIVIATLLGLSRKMGAGVTALATTHAGAPGEPHSLAPSPTSRRGPLRRRFTVKSGIRGNKRT